jgi:biopolymer transport protein ExbD
MNVWKLRREGSPVSSADLTFDQVMQSLLDGKIHLNDEIKGPTDADWVKVEDHPAFAETAADLEEEPERRVEEETRLDMNALIDVSLVLLIFFILTTTYATLQKLIEAADVSDQKTTGVTTIKDPKVVDDTMIRVKVTYAKGGKSTIFVEGKEVEPDQVVNELKRISGASKQKRTLLLEHDEKVPHGVIVGIQDDARSAQLEKVLLLVP